MALNGAKVWRFQVDRFRYPKLTETTQLSQICLSSLLTSQVLHMSTIKSECSNHLMTWFYEGQLQTSHELYLLDAVEVVF